MYPLVVADLRLSAMPKIILDRYEILEEIASGGMATVYRGRMVGPVGFSRSVAIKRLHPHLAKEPDFVAMFLDEARLAARIRHPNVVPTLDIVVMDDDLFLVMEYVEGESLARLMELVTLRGERMPPAIAASILVGVLSGLHAAHEAKGEDGKPLGIIHRDVSPQNVIVGYDGVARVLDFGIAKAQGRLHTTKEGRLFGKLAYMAPERVKGEPLTRAADIYGAAVVLWEALAGRRLFEASNDAELLEVVLRGAAVSEKSPLDRICAKGLRLDPSKRFTTARDMAREIERHGRLASASDVSEWVEAVHGSGPRPALIVDSSGAARSFDLTSKRTSKRVRMALVGMVVCVTSAGAAGVWRWRHSTKHVNATPTSSPSISATESAPMLPRTEDSNRAMAPAKAHTAPLTRSGPHTVPDAKRQQCNPPYVVDGQGVKRYKVECL